MPTWEEIQQGIKGVLQPLGEYANIATLMPNWIKAAQALPYMIQEQPIPPELTPENPSFNERINQTLQNLKENLPTDPEEMMNRGLPMMPSVGAVIRPNFRSPKQIQALRRIMAEEQRARGPFQIPETPTQIIEYSEGSKYPWRVRLSDQELHQKSFKTKQEALDNIARFTVPDYKPDPIDQILRGSWYHGMSEKARLENYKQKLPEGFDFRNMWTWPDELLKEINPLNIPDREMTQTLANKLGFPISRHDTQSISNKLGEPAGVSLSLNPTVSQKFSADENIFRVMPLYGGPPTQRTVNLMTPEGRKLLNDAYDVVANKTLMEFPRSRQYMEGVLESGYDPGKILQNIIEDKGISQGYNIGPFNQALSDQLQGQGYRHILYNPQRWNEYEMLALDPKYALPLDYRQMGEYVAHRQPGYPEQYIKDMDMVITPKAREGIYNIQDLMSQNASRLGDIYKERSWWDRINEGIKRVLLQDNPNAEQIIRKLKGETTPTKKESLFGMFNLPAGEL